MEMEVHIILGLQNDTQSTQQMDQGFTENKPVCNTGTICFAPKEMTIHVAARKKMMEKECPNQPATNNSTPVTNHEEFWNDTKEMLLMEMMTHLNLM